MTLLELKPKWLNANLFLFLCPHCQKVWLSCKNIVMTMHDQYALFQAHLGDDWNLSVVPCKKEMAWAFSGSDFGSFSVTPSLDASKSGHWHGFITNGAIV